MNVRYTTVFLTTLTVALAFALGVSLTFIVRIYDVAEKDLVLTTGFYKRIVTLDNIDLSRGVIGATTVDREIARVRQFIFSVDERTQFQKQSPIFENDVIVGYSPLENISPTELREGDEAFIRLQTLEDGRLYSSVILIGRPFTQP